jgi:hypothetical protein
MAGMNANAVNDKLAKFADTWCERRDLGPLAVLLPAWLNNNGLTDGWANLANALLTLSTWPKLPETERAAIKLLWIEVDSAVKHR